MWAWSVNLGHRSFIKRGISQHLKKTTFALFRAHIFTFPNTHEILITPLINISDIILILHLISAKLNLLITLTMAVVKP